MTTADKEHTPQKVAKKSKNPGSVRKPYVKRACTNCKKAHAACTEERPCKRCIQQGVAHECVDSERKKPTTKKKRSSSKQLKMGDEASTSSSAHMPEINPFYPYHMTEFYGTPMMMNPHQHYYASQQLFNQQAATDAAQQSFALMPYNSQMFATQPGAVTNPYSTSQLALAGYGVTPDIYQQQMQQQQETSNVDNYHDDMMDEILDVSSPVPSEPKEKVIMNGSTLNSPTDLFYDSGERSPYSVLNDDHKKGIIFEEAKSDDEDTNSSQIVDLVTRNASLLQNQKLDHHHHHHHSTDDDHTNDDEDHKREDNINMLMNLLSESTSSSSANSREVQVQELLNSLLVEDDGNNNLDSNQIVSILKPETQNGESSSVDSRSRITTLSNQQLEGLLLRVIKHFMMKEASRDKQIERMNRELSTLSKMVTDISSNYEEVAKELRNLRISKKHETKPS